MPRCPHLGLVEVGSNPFPFPSVSHHCYVSMPGRPAGQQEQETYCLTKSYVSCPLFPSPPVEEIPGAAVPEPMPKTVEPEAAVRTSATEAIDIEEAFQPSPDRSAEILPPEPEPEPVVEEPAVEEVGTDPAAGEVLAEPEPILPVATAEPVAVEEPHLDLPSEPTLRIEPGRPRSLARTVAGVAALAFLCLGAMATGVVVGLASGLDISTLQLPTPGSSLLLVSGASFAGAVLLLGLLLWARRRGSP